MQGDCEALAVSPDLVHPSLPVYPRAPRPQAGADRAAIGDGLLGRLASHQHHHVAVAVLPLIAWCQDRQPGRDPGRAFNTDFLRTACVIRSTAPPSFWVAGDQPELPRQHPDGE
jgi:hypothetical protein